MRPTRPGSHAIFRITVAVFVLALVATAATAVNANRPITDVVVAVTAVSGVFALYLESRRGKNIAMGEFILNLNSEFDSNPERAMIHKKIIAGDRLSEVDKPALVAYLTFFEIIYRLIVSQVVKMEVVDDLFRSRFFRAVHHVDVQNLELLPDADGYRNIYELEQMWIRHLVGQGIELQRGDRKLPKSAALRSRDQIHFSFKVVDTSDAMPVYRLIEVAGETTNPAEFVVNDFATIERQMRSGLTILATKGDEGEAVGVLHVYFPQPHERLSRHVNELSDVPIDEIAHMDVGVVAPRSRGYGLLSLLLIEAESKLQERNPERRHLLATVHPDNGASLRSFEFAGYARVAEIVIHETLPRILLAKHL